MHFRDSARGVAAGFLFLISPCYLVFARDAQDPPPSQADLAATTERGRSLAAYDRAVWHATDSLQTADPKTAQNQHCLAHFANGRWTVVFGHLNSDKSRFLISHEAAQESKPESFIVTRDDPPREETGFFLFAGRALEVALADFGKASRPY
ncbi:MAG TPA: hypothetical protein VKB24_00400, partial [Candidatus Acidoferrum sp.]|nr:hypothetical protein [Candidatus Acidoferrum sp.]